MSHLDEYKVSVPEGRVGDWSVDRFTVGEHDLGRIRHMFDGRDPGHGEFTRLCEGETVWMSDTHAEVRDHLGAIYEMRRESCQRVLIHGLGLGVVVQAALHADAVRHVDVVEINPAVIELVGDHYLKMAAEAGKSLVIHNADAWTYQWPKGTRWDVAWHDIWPTITGDDYEEHKTMRRKFGHRVGWQACWAEHHVKRMR